MTASAALNPLLGIALKIASTFVFTMMASAVRLVGEHIPTGQIVFFRSALALLPVLLWVAWQGELKTALKTDNFVGHAVRTLTGLTAMFLGFFALRVLPLADATAIGYAAPLITVALAVVILGERVRIYRWSAVIIGLVGVVVMLYPHLQGLGRIMTDRTVLGAIMAFFGACFVALTMIIVRKLTAREKTAAIVLYFSLNSALFSLVTLPTWVMPSWRDLAILATIGLIGGVGQLLLTASYRYAEASTIAPLEYASMVWALLIGLVVFHEVPAVSVLIGAAIVVASGLFVVWRERQLGIRRAPLTRDMPPAGA